MPPNPKLGFTGDDEIEDDKYEVKSRIPYEKGLLAKCIE
jgi:hypothetical protein